MDNKSICENDKEFVVMASSSSLRLRNDNSANSPKNSNMDIAEHDEEFTVMASSSLPLSVIDDSPNNPNCSSINMAQDTDENVSAVSSSSLQRTRSSEFYEADLFYYLELYKVVLNGDWESASKLLEDDPKSFSTPMLHIAVELGEATMGFVEKLVQFMPSPALSLPGSNGATALFTAAKAGNIKAAKLFVEKKSNLPNICNHGNLVPLHTAVRYGHKELTLYLLSVTRDDVDPSPFADKPGFELLRRALMVGFHDVALYLVKRYPDLATCNFGDAKDSDDDIYSDDDKAPLTVLAKRPWAFRSGSRFNLWQLIIYHCVPVKLNHFLSQPNRGGMENQVGSYELSTQMCYWTRLFKVPPIKHIQETKTMHTLTLQLLKHLCTEVLKVSRAEEIFGQAFITGAKYGIPEILEEIIKSYSSALEYLDEDVFKLAVLNRYEKIFNLICETGMHRQLIIRTRDDTNNDNILHLAGKLAPLHRLSLVSGAALQMQRELHWFKEIEKYAPRAFSESENENEDTPKMVFIKAHKELIKEGEKWMKGTAKSYTLAAALIATVVFAAAISIPGGNHDDTGIPNFSEEYTFKFFAVSDALSLFLSVASVLIFLSILTARYAEGDFLFTLPRRLISGLVTLFLSVTFMMIAYSSAIYLIFGEKKAWILITLGALACLPVTLYGILQFPLLVELIYSTYGPGIFGKHSNRLIR
ncbi:uncharacterized protein LOC117908457 isoform X2 [Vitis riparia]|uniref:uncharacterized protein LOC117908457 isoform X2 n=1 Tax=Vitis riparia TaxID=96939 RepID=UPI00155A565E|nr:uncharacterized protein LOC117908457 isoform X2 [Vitis riparia]